mgnify:CR=1 FL=1
MANFPACLMKANRYESPQKKPTYSRVEVKTRTSRCNGGITKARSTIGATTLPITQYKTAIDHAYLEHPRAATETNPTTSRQNTHARAEAAIGEIPVGTGSTLTRMLHNGNPAEHRGSHSNTISEATGLSMFASSLLPASPATTGLVPSALESAKWQDGA